MAINKVDFGGRTLIDLTQDDLTDAGQLVSGVKAHTRAGVQITGTFAGQTKSVTPITSAQSVTPDTGKWLSRVTVGAIPSEYVDLSTLKLHCTQYNTGTFITASTLLQNITISCGFRPKVFIIRTGAAIRTKINRNGPFPMVGAYSVWDDNNHSHVRSMFVFYDDRSQYSSYPVTGSQSGSNYFEQTATGVQGVGSSVKTSDGSGGENVTYTWYTWG